MRAFRTALAGLILALLLLPPTFAQDDEPDLGLKNRPRRKDDDKPKFGDPPPKPEKPDKPKTEPKVADPVGALLDKLITWPDDDARQAMTQLAVAKDAALPRVRALLSHKKREMRGAAAEWLGRHGTKEDAARIATAALDRRVGSRATVYLEAIARKDVSAAIDCALEMVKTSPRVMKERAALFLRSRIASVDRARVEALLKAKTSNARLFALEILAKGFGPDAARDAAFGLLGDRSPEVCLRAAIALGSDAEARERLISTAKPFDTREAHYAMLAIALSGVAEGKQPIDAETIRMLLGSAGIDSLDELPRAVAAIALGHAGFLERDEAVDAALDTRILPALLDSIGGSRFFRDIPAVRDPSIQVLGLLTGQRFGPSVRGWRDWWATNRIGFRARRLLRSIRPADYRELRLEILVPGRPSEMFSGAPADLVRGALIFDAARAEALVGKLNDLGFFGDEWSASRRKGDLAVFAEVRGRERLRATSPARVGEKLDDLVRTIETYRNDLGWQRYWDRSEFPRPERFIEAKAPEFALSVSADRRAAALKRVIAEALDDLTSTQRLAALRRMASLDGTPPLDLRLAAQLLRLVEAETGFGVFAREATELLVREHEAEIRDQLIDVLAKARGHDAPRLLSAALAAYGPEFVARSTVDSRSVVRRAAARALESSESVDAITRLEALLMDEERSVRVQALVSLGALQAESAKDEIARLAVESKEIEVRCAAIRALGAVGRGSVTTTLIDALRDEQVAVRIAAIQGLRATGVREALAPLFFALARDKHGAVRTMAGQAIVAFGGDEAKAGLARLADDESARPNARVVAVKSLWRLGAVAELAEILESESPVIADEAAFALGGLRDRRGVPRLLDALAAKRNPSRALTALEGASARTFGPRPAAELATLFLGWWRSHKEGTPTDWLLSALNDRGYRIESLGGDRMDPDVLRVLVIALRDDSWAIRHAASRELAARAGEDLGEIGKFDAREEAERVAELWRRWWEGRFGEGERDSDR